MNKQIDILIFGLKSRGLKGVDKVSFSKLIKECAECGEDLPYLAIEHVAAGVESSEEMRLADLVFQSVSVETTQTLDRAGIKASFIDVYRWLQKRSENSEVIRRAQKGEESAMKDLRSEWPIACTERNDGAGTKSGCSVRAFTDAGEVKRTFRKHHFYASKAAMTVEVSDLKRPGEGDRRRTLQFDIARRISDERIDWENKVVFQLTLSELVRFAKGCVSDGASITFSNHGEAKNKEFHYSKRPDGTYIRIRQGSRALAIPIKEGEDFYLVSCALEAIRENEPHLDGSLIALLLKSP